MTLITFCRATTLRRMLGAALMAGAIAFAGAGGALAGGGGDGGDGGGGFGGGPSGSSRSASTKSAPSVASMMGDAGERVIVIDVRPKADFAKSHLRGAINMPQGQLDKAALGSNKSARIVVYGANEKDEAASKLARSIIGEGFTNVIWMRGGFAEWVAARLPTDAATAQTATN